MAEAPNEWAFKGGGEMKLLKGLVLSCLLLCVAGSLLADPNPAGDGSGKQEAAGGEKTMFTCPIPQSDEEVALEITLPAGWTRNTAFGTVVFDPPDAGDFYEAPRIEIQALCEGECRAEEMAGNIDSYVQRLKEGWKTLSTGDENLDKLGANVEVLKDEKAGDSRVFAVSLTYPDGVSDSMYPPRFWIYRFVHKPGEPYFILVKGKVPATLKNDFYSVVGAACGTVDEK